MWVVSWDNTKQDDASGGRVLASFPDFFASGTKEAERDLILGLPMSAEVIIAICKTHDVMLGWDRR